MQTVSQSEISRVQKTILVLENDIEVLSFIKESIIGDKYHITAALTGEDALNQIVKTDGRRIDLAILDHFLPDMSGLEVLKKIKDISPSIPVIYMTGYGNEDIAAKAFRYGACDYFKKPFSSFEMIKKIDFLAGQELSDTPSKESDISQERSIGECYLQTVSSGQHSYQMQKALKYINENYATKLRLKKVAQIACMSEYYFSRIFKREVGITYQEYLNRCRIETAKKYLKNKALTITEIGFAVGYDDLSNFIYIFQKITGRTPSQFARHCDD